jgi:5-methylcytosine-specific restriction endonuclease McrA
MSRTYIPVPLKRLVIERTRRRCEYCCAPDTYAAVPFHVDHIVPEARGGTTTEDNLAYSCGCNGFKGASMEGIDPETGMIVPLFHPRRDTWNEHFASSEDFLEVRGKTAVGRASVIVLHMDRPTLVALRRLLLAHGEHPPVEE